MQSDFSTNDILLAAALSYFGLQCDLKPSNDNLFVFTFAVEDKEEKEKMDEIIRKYWAEELVVEPRRFNSIIRGMKAEMKK